MRAQSIYNKLKQQATVSTCYIQAEFGETKNIVHKTTVGRSTEKQRISSIASFSYSRKRKPFRNQTTTWVYLAYPFLPLIMGKKGTNTGPWILPTLMAKHWHCAAKKNLLQNFNSVKTISAVRNWWGDKPGMCVPLKLPRAVNQSGGRAQAGTMPARKK